jgi:hypothetical protein
MPVSLALHAFLPFLFLCLCMLSGYLIGSTQIFFWRPSLSSNQSFVNRDHWQAFLAWHGRDRRVGVMLNSPVARVEFL